MSKILIVMTFILLSQTAYANDFLLPSKQLLICEQGEVLFRINWEDWDVENKSFAIRTKNQLKQFNLNTDREGPEILYLINVDYTDYNKGKANGYETSVSVIGPDIEQEQSKVDSYRFRFVDKAANEIQAKKVCKK